jgi:hypothetical protein
MSIIQFHGELSTGQHFNHNSLNLYFRFFLGHETPFLWVIFLISSAFPGILGRFPVLATNSFLFRNTSFFAVRDKPTLLSQGTQFPALGYNFAKAAGELHIALVIPSCYLYQKQHLLLLLWDHHPFVRHAGLENFVQQERKKY